MKAHTRPAIVILALLLTLTAAKCQDKDLRDIVKASDKVADTVSVVQKATIDFETAGTLTRNQARAIMQLSIQISQANNRSMDIARDLSKLDTPTRAQLLAILKPIIQAVDKGLNDQNILGIQNPQTRDAIKGAFIAIQSSLNSINLILSSGK